MKQIIEDQVRLAINAAKTWARSNETLYNVLDGIANLAAFSDLAVHELMLADTVRVNTYAAAIRRHVHPGDVVVDLGTGTGILAILAAREGATVYAIDHSDFVTVAEQVARGNGVDSIEFRRVHSKDFTCPEGADVVLHEQLGDGLFDENMVENLLDLKRRVLKDTGTIVPGRFDLFLEPVSLDEDHRVPFLWDTSVHGIDFGFLRDSPDIEKFKSEGYSERRLKAGAIDSFLSTPRPILSFDLNEMEDAGELPANLEASRRVERPRTMDGLCLFFRVVFDDELQFDTAPYHAHTHWRNRLLRTPQREYDEGDVLSYAVAIENACDTKTWSVSVEDDPAGDPEGGRCRDRTDSRRSAILER